MGFSFASSKFQAAYWYLLFFILILEVVNLLQSNLSPLNILQLSRLH